MRQFQVPQFITVEDKVFGPFTIKQFLYLAGGALLILGARAVLKPFIFFPIAALIGGLAAGLAFIKINEQPFPIVLKNAVFYFLRPRLYIWKRDVQKPKAENVLKSGETFVRVVPKLSESKLTDLAWSLDIKTKDKDQK